MFGALKPGFRSLATLKVTVNVVGERKEQLRHRAVSLRQHGFLVNVRYAFGLSYHIALKENISYHVALLRSIARH